MKKKIPAGKTSLNPLMDVKSVCDDLLETNVAEIKTTTKKVATMENQSAKKRKIRFTVHIEEELGAKVKDYLFFKARRDETICSIFEKAISLWIKDFEKNEGVIPKKGEGKVRPGRPPKYDYSMDK